MVNVARTLLREVIPFDPPTQQVLTTNLPEMVCVLLVRFAVNRQSLRLPRSLDGKFAGETWTAHREPGTYEVGLVQEQGTLKSCVMLFSLQGSPAGDYTCWVQGGYRPRERMLFGTLEDHSARSHAHKLRAGMIEVVKYSLETFGQKSGPDLRQFERRPTRGVMRIRAGSRSLMVQLLNISEGGIGAALPCTMAESSQLSSYLTAQKVFEAEMIDPRIGVSFRVMVRHAKLVKGGLLIGLKVQDPRQIAPLIQRAFGRKL